MRARLRLIERDDSLGSDSGVRAAVQAHSGEGQYGSFRVLRCQFFDERERIEARSAECLCARTDISGSGIDARQLAAMPYREVRILATPRGRKGDRVH